MIGGHIVSVRPRWMAVRRDAIVAAALLGIISTACPAQAQLILSQVIVDLTPDKPARDDIEAFNGGKERMYVEVQPAEILNPGTPDERRIDVADPTIGGLLVTPQRMILEPGERRLIRAALLVKRPEKDRVYRITVKPVVGELAAPASALKVLVGYDVLLLARPSAPMVTVNGSRDGRTLQLVNTGNTSVEIFGGRQCDTAGSRCLNLPSIRLYAGARWVQTLPGDGPVTYQIKMANSETKRSF